MAKSPTKTTLANTNKPYPPPSGSTQSIVRGGTTGAAPRTIPAHDGMTKRQIAEGRAMGRDLSPGVKVGAEGRDLTAGAKEGA